MPHQLPGDNKCTGCGACINICPTIALSMQENEEGFLSPSINESLCIDCGRCEAVCPVYNPASDNSKTPSVYAFMAPNDVRMGSASGGFFPMVAESILGRGGIVCGAAFDKHGILRHELADNKQTLQRLRSSKYAQSKTGFIYRTVKSLLKNGRQVLFSGTPCQVAGLKHFLGKNYDNLLTADIICLGVPPQSLLQRHLLEKGLQAPYKRIDFRSKSYPWGTHVMRVELENGITYEKLYKEDPYYLAFMSAISLRKSCYDCPFCEYPRQGDITMGDFWGYEKLTGQKADAKGISIVLVNTDKGKEHFNLLNKENCSISQINCDPASIPNRVGRHMTVPPGRDRFFALLKSMSVAKAVAYALEQKFDIAYFGPYYSTNFGGTLTHFALYHVLTDLGYTTMMVAPPAASAKVPEAIREIYDPGSWPDYVFAGVFANKMQMRRLNEKCDIFITGSDQFFNGSCYPAVEKCVIQDWVEDSKKKIAYAASFGHDVLYLSQTDREEMAFFLSRFDYFSVREISGVDICKKEFGVHATHVLDPVFLCNIDHYRRLASLSPQPRCSNKRYLYAYILDASTPKQKMIEELCSLKDMEYILYSDWFVKNGFYLKLSRAKINKRLLDLMNCDFVITDSFHGVCFSIIFKKSFIVWSNKVRGDARFDSILGEAGLLGRRVYDWDEYVYKKEELLTPIDYERVAKRLEPRITFSHEWLIKALQAQLNKRLSDFDMAMRKINELETRFNAQYQQMQKEIGAKLADIKMT